MSIISELNKKGISIVKSDRFYRGYYTTDNGIIISIKESECKNGIYFLQNNKANTFPCNNKTIYIASGTEYDGKIKSIEEAERLANDGEILSFKSSDLYAEYYDFPNNKELECCFKYGYSSKSRDYIESVMKDIGLVEYIDVLNSAPGNDGVPLDFDIICECDLFLNATTEIGKIDDETWIAQTCFQVDIDDFSVVKMYFNHEPSEEDLNIAFYIRKFEQKPIEVFTCWECGHTVNWLDLEGNICKKYDLAENKYCGC